MVFRVRLRIHGRVQGVFYRKSAEEHANSLGLSGWVRNMADGSVEAFAVGSKDALLSYIEWCRKGPSYAHVELVDEVWLEAAAHFADDEKVEPGSIFTIRH